jgi:transposase-like protein
MEILNQTPVKEPKVRGRPPTYNQEFMSMVAKKVFEGELTYREAGKTFGVSSGSISSWVRQFKKGSWTQAKKVREANEKVRFIRLESHVRELKQEIGELYLENLMLKKALQYSQQSKRENSSVITSENLDQFQKDAK